MWTFEQEMERPFDRNQIMPFKSAFIVSGCPGDSERYRSRHQADQLQILGLTVATASYDNIDYESIAPQFDLFVLHRVAHTQEVETFIQVARALGKPVVFDTDDLLFNTSLAREIKALRNYTKDETELCMAEMRGHHKTMSLCSATIVTTEALRDSVRELFPDMPVYINRNAVSHMMTMHAEDALGTLPARTDKYVRIAYFSGTRTHQDDFDECAPALARLLTRYPMVRLMIVGYLDVPDILKCCADQLEIQPWVPWDELPALLRRTDINLAPLEMGNRFTAAKSELKYFEAGLLGVPTVASRVAAYQVAIRTGDNGFLCGSSQEWHDTVERLINEPELRKRVGENARRDVLLRYTSQVRALELGAVLTELYDGSSSK